MSEASASPWAMEFSDEEKFEKTVSISGKLLRDDKNLHAWYYIMMTPSSSSSQETRVSMVYYVFFVKFMFFVSE